MRILFFGDLVGKAGRKALHKYLPELKSKLNPELIIVNAENSAGGFGITKKIMNEILLLGVDIISTGNHAFDKKEDIDIFNHEKRLIRPINYPAHAPGSGSLEYQTNNGKKILFIHALGQLGMRPVDDPCQAVINAIGEKKLGVDFDAIIIEIHAEMTSEKYSMGHFFDGRVSMVVGSHTHIPTADAHIMEHGTAFQCDLGMCGDYNSVIGMEKSGPVMQFSQKIYKARLKPALGEASLCGVMVDLFPSGLAKNITPIRLGGVIGQNLNIGDL